MKTTVIMNHLRSTKSTHIYVEDICNKETAIPSLYVKQSALPKNPPKVILVTIESQE
jgi:hypothetical protein